MEENESESAALDAVAETESTETSDAQAELASQDAANQAAAVAVLAKARAARPAIEDDDAADGGEAAGTEEAAPPAKAAIIPVETKVEPTKDDQAATLLSRLNQLEAAHRQTAAENKSLKEAAARASKWDAAAKAAQEGDISTVARELGWSPEAIVKYIEGGQDAVKDVVADKKVSAVEQKLADLEKRYEMAEGQRAILEYKGTISREVSGLSAEVPFLVNDFTDPETGTVDAAGMTDAVFALQTALYNDAKNPRQVSTAEAAKLLNQVREASYKRLQGRKAIDPKTVDAAAKDSATPAKKQEPVVKKPRVSLPPTEGTDPHLADALATLKSFRSKRQAESQDDLD